MRAVVVRFIDAGHADGQVRGVLEEVGTPPVPFRSATDLLELLLAVAGRSGQEPTAPPDTPGTGAT